MPPPAPPVAPLVAPTKGAPPLPPAPPLLSDGDPPAPPAAQPSSGPTAHRASAKIDTGAVRFVMPAVCFHRPPAIFPCLRADEKSSRVVFVIVSRAPCIHHPRADDISRRAAPAHARPAFTCPDSEGSRCRAGPPLPRATGPAGSRTARDRGAGRP